MTRRDDLSTDLATICVGNGEVWLLQGEDGGMMSLPRRLRRIDTSEAASAAGSVSIVPGAGSTMRLSFGVAAGSCFWSGDVDMCNSIEMG